MEYPAQKPHHRLLQDLQKGFLFDEYRSKLGELLAFAGDDPVAQLEIYYYYYDAYWQMGHIGEAAEMLECARRLQHHDNPELIIFSLLLEARAHYYQRNIEQSELYLQRALTLVNGQSGYLFLLAQENKVLINYELKKEFDEGIKSCRLIIEKADKRFKRIIAIAYNALGSIYSTIGELAEAEQNYNRALVLSNELGDLYSIANIYSNLGGIAYRIWFFQKVEDRLTEALQWLLRAKEVNTRTSDVRNRIVIHSHLGRIYANLGKFPEAIQFWQEAVLYARNANITYSLAVALLTHADILLQAKDFPKALEVLEECHSYHDTMTLQTQEALYERLCRVSKEMQAYEKGFAYALQLVKIQKEFADKNNSGVLYQNKILAEKLQLEHDLHTLRLRTIEEKMQSQAAQFVSQTELLSKFRDELREIARKYPSTDPGWREVKEKLKELPCKQIDWEKFETEFNAVHPEFQKKLLVQFPLLTPTEARMCSLLRLNLKSQEIGRLFCLSDRTIENHRFNIRRKLRLPREQSISVFLNSL